MIKQKYKPSPSHHHFYKWYVYHSQSWPVYSIVLITSKTSMTGRLLEPGPPAPTWSPWDDRSVSKPCRVPRRRPAMPMPMASPDSARQPFRGEELPPMRSTALELMKSLGRSGGAQNTSLFHHWERMKKGSSLWKGRIEPWKLRIVVFFLRI